MDRSVLVDVVAVVENGGSCLLSLLWKMAEVAEDD